MNELRLYNTLSQNKERFEPLGPGPVGVYSCGPTVYSRQHIGNLRPYVFADLLKRTLRYFGHEVRHVINITDVGHLTDDGDGGDDKVERAARQTRTPALEIAEHWTELFQRDLRLINVDPPNVWPKASEHVEHQIRMIQTLEHKGFTYLLDDGLYFDTARDPGYGELARLRASAEHTRIAGAGEKCNPADFALWKLSSSTGPRRQLEWPSPWGVGFPGWHIECSAMATHYLGERFEIHTGGIDHVAVHHTNEIAQSENALGVRPWVKYWMHGGWLTAGGDKISKSKGHSLSLDDLVARRISPGAYRYYLLTAHYRQPLAFSMEALEGAQAAFERLALLAAGDTQGSQQTAHAEAFRAALADDLNAPAALGVLWHIARDQRLSAVERGALLGELGGVLGLDFGAARVAKAGAPDTEIDALVAERTRARDRRDFARADALRNELLARGIVVEDTADGPRWQRA